MAVNRAVSAVAAWGAAVWSALTRRHRAPRTSRSPLSDDTRSPPVQRLLARLRATEAQYRAIFEATGDGMVISDPHGNVVAVNSAACAMMGCDREGAVGRPLEQFIGMDDPVRYAAWMARVAHDTTAATSIVGHRDDGALYHLEVHARSFDYGGHPHWLSVIRDVTDRTRSIQLLEQRVQERTRELATLLQVSRDVASTLELAPLLAKTLDRLGEVVPYDAAAIFTLDEGHELTLLDYRGPRPRHELARRWDLSEAEPMRMVLDHRQPLTIPDVHAETLQAAAWQRAWGAQLGRLAENSASWLGVPLMVKERVIGTMTLEHAEVGYFTPLHAKLALTFANQVAVAIENARLYEASQRLGVLEERQRIARELHDSVSQTLYGIGLGARTAQALLDRDPQEAGEPLAYVISLAETGLAEMRALIFELRPESLVREGLASALTKQATALCGHHGLDVTTRCDQELALPAEVQEALYRVAHEALNNTVKHATAQRVVVTLAGENGVVMLSIQDDGTGFDPQGSYPGHYGLLSMRERIGRLGGTLTIESAPGQGTRVQAVVPVREGREGHGTAARG